MQTNIVFWLVVVVALVICWFSMSFLFKSIGGWFIDLFNDAKHEIAEDEKKEENL